jgi:hypothetical protein
MGIIDLSEFAEWSPVILLLFATLLAMQLKLTIMFYFFFRKGSGIISLNS